MEKLKQAFSYTKASQQKEKSKEKQREAKRSKEENRGHSCSLPSHFWRTSRSPFFTCYKPFQSSGSQESNTSNHVQFGAEMRKIWPSEANCSRLCENFAQHLPNSHTPLHGVNFPLFLPTPHEIFSFVFFYENSFLIPIISQSQALLL